MDLDVQDVLVSMTSQDKESYDSNHRKRKSAVHFRFVTFSSTRLLLFPQRWLAFIFD